MWKTKYVVPPHLIALALALVLLLVVSTRPTSTLTPVRSSESPTVEAKGYVLYMPGISPLPPILDYRARERVEWFIPAELRELVQSEGFIPAWFSYRPTGGYGGGDAEYSHTDTRQHLEISAVALDEQIRGVISEWQGEERAVSVPEIVIVAHSLGGAGAARWASYADAELLDSVRTVFTFDSPVAGVGDIRGLFGGDAGDDLTNPDELARIAYGTSRLDFAQVGNTEDLIIQFDESFTPDGWRKLSVSCESLTDIGDHYCSMKDPISLEFVKTTLNESPPLWSKLVPRPDAITDIDLADALWTVPTANQSHGRKPAIRDTWRN